jgi:hypothetical protein
MQLALIIKIQWNLDELQFYFSDWYYTGQLKTKFKSLSINQNVLSELIKLSLCLYNCDYIKLDVF